MASAAPRPARLFYPEALECPLIDLDADPGRRRHDDRAVDQGVAAAKIDGRKRLAERVGAGSVVLFHHGPHRTDDALDEIAKEFAASIPIVIAAEGLALDLV